MVTYCPNKDTFESEGKCYLLKKDLHQDIRHKLRLSWQNWDILLLL